MLSKKLFACILIISGIAFAARRTGGYVPVTQAGPDYDVPPSTSGNPHPHLATAFQPGPIIADVTFTLKDAPRGTTFKFWTAPMVDDDGNDVEFGSDASLQTIGTSAQAIPGLGFLLPNSSNDHWTNKDSNGNYSARSNSLSLSMTTATHLVQFNFSLTETAYTGTPASTRGWDFFFYYELDDSTGKCLDSGSKIIRLHPSGTLAPVSITSPPHISHVKLNHRNANIPIRERYAAQRALHPGSSPKRAKRIRHKARKLG